MASNDPRYAKKQISNVAAQAIYDKMVEQDRILDDAMGEISHAASAIADATRTAHDAYAKRTAIAQELAELAAEDFAPSEPPRASGRATPAGRFYRPSPFSPVPMSMGGKRRGSANADRDVDDDLDI